MIKSEKLLFRFQRGSLDDSMKTVQEIKTYDQLISLAMGDWHITPIKLEIKPYVYDKRINWDTHLVIIHTKDMSYPIGYLNRNPEWNK